MTTSVIYTFQTYFQETRPSHCMKQLMPSRLLKVDLIDIYWWIIHLSQLRGDQASCSPSHNQFPSARQQGQSFVYRLKNGGPCSSFSWRGKRSIAQGDRWNIRPVSDMVGVTPWAWARDCNLRVRVPRIIRGLRLSERDSRSYSPKC